MSERHSGQGDGEREGDRQATLSRLGIAAGVANALLAFGAVSALTVAVMVQEARHPGGLWHWPARILPLAVIPVTLAGYAVGAIAATGVLTRRERWWRDLLDLRLLGGLGAVFAGIALWGAVLDLAATTGWIEGPLGWMLALVALNVAWRVLPVVRGRTKIGAAVIGVGWNALFIGFIFGGGSLLWSALDPQTKAGQLTLLVAELVFLGALVVGWVVLYPYWRVVRVFRPLWRGDYDQAAELAEQLHPSGDPVRAIVAAIRLEQGDLDAAEAYMEREFPDLRPGDPKGAYTYGIKGWLHLARGELDEAGTWFERASEISGGHGRSGAIRVKLALHQVDEETLAAADKVVHQTSTPLVFKLLGADLRRGSLALRSWVLARLGHADRAREDIARVLQDLPTGMPGHTSVLHWQVAQALSELGDVDVARVQLEAGAQAPGHYGALCREALGKGPLP